MIALVVAPLMIYRGIKFPAKVRMVVDPGLKC